MAKRKRRRPFESTQRSTSQSFKEKHIEVEQGVFAFLRDYSVRETVESIIVAVLLALMFRAYEAEAFIIPTGSMAPSLQGQHMDVVCDECGFQYRTGASLNASNHPRHERADVTKTYCPVCRYGMPMRKQQNPDHVSNNGDRILVNKFIYDFADPERFDVIVFKNPNNGKQNYIKRLVGLPGDKLLIENGDIYNFVADENGNEKKQIIRKPLDKVRVMLQLVDDTHFRSASLRSANWPERWQQWDDPNSDWKNNESDGHAYFLNDGTSEQMKWLRYRHLVPRSEFDELVYSSGRIGTRKRTEWEHVEAGELPPRIKNPKTGEISPGSLIRDYYEYNDRRYQFRDVKLQSRVAPENHLSQASHWVGDLAMECDLEVESSTGVIALDLVEGGVNFRCSIDVKTGQAKLETVGDDGNIKFDAKSPTAQTPIQKPGNYTIQYCNLDDMLYLWVDGKHIEFDGSSYVRIDGKRPIPKYSESNPRDAEPLGIGSANTKLRVNRLKVFRDVYYVAPTNKDIGGVNIRNETGYSAKELVITYEYPQLWGKSKVFDRPQSNKPMFVMEDGWYFPMGDNSPASQDARIWNGPNYVSEDYMIGRAMFVYWPHSLNSPIKYFPNFKRMGFIR